MFDIKNSRTIIISSPRSGSTALSELIATTNNKALIVEPWNNPNRTMNDYFKLISSDERVLVKFHALDYFKYSDMIDISSFYKIRIRRRRLDEQIASFYLSNKRNHWYYHKDKDYDFSSEVDINLKTINNCVNLVKKYNRFVDTYDFLQGVTFDDDIWYEDISEILFVDQEISSAISKKPKNYQELLEAIRTTL